MRIAYIVHDLADAAVARRVAMLGKGGAGVDLYGFRRAGGTPAQVAGVVPHELGATKDGKLAQRAGSLLWHSATARDWARPMAQADLIIARNLDNLALAAVARRRLGLKIPIVYELLDVHTVMFKDHAAARLLRALEGRLLQACDGVVISSPAFERDYLARFHPRRPGALLVENKVLAEVAYESTRPSLADGPPWKIGWFGGIRCRPSLEILSSLLKAHPGLFEVDIRGRFVASTMGDALDVVRGTPGMRYHGPYRYPDDLAEIYSAVHFAWAIDFFQEGANSDWLLPNRLYEGSLYGAVPIALRGVETGRWLSEHGLGLLVDATLEQSLLALLSTMTPQVYRTALIRLQAADRGLFQLTDADCENLVRRLGEVGHLTAA